LRAVRRERRVVELRRRGWTFAAIADEVGYSNAGGAKKAFDRGMDRGRREPAELHRLLELMRLDQLLWSINCWQARATTHSQQLRSIDIKLEIFDLRMALTCWNRYKPAQIRTNEADARCEQLLKGIVTALIDCDWTEALRLRETGATFDEIASRLGLTDGTAARRIVERDLILFLAGHVDLYRAEVLEVNEEMFRDLWLAAIGPKARPVDIRRVLKTMRTRAELLQLCPTRKDVSRLYQQEQKRRAAKIRRAVDAEPYPGFPMCCGEQPDHITTEHVDSMLEMHKQNILEHQKQ
jgi:hypothetical protein